MTQSTAILKALSFQKYNSTPLIERARQILKQNTGEGMSACSTNRLRELREKGYIESEKDLLSEELIWNITDEGRKHLAQSLAVKFQ